MIFEQINRFLLFNGVSERISITNSMMEDFTFFMRLMAREPLATEVVNGGPNDLCYTASETLSRIMGIYYPWVT